MAGGFDPRSNIWWLGSRMPRHVHHCRAIAYTTSGSWDYDEGHFSSGESAWEQEGNDHTPWSDEGAELFITFDGNNGCYLDNFLPDGTCVKLDFPFLKALEGLSLAETAELDFHSLVEIVPPAVAWKDEPMVSPCWGWHGLALQVFLCRVHHKLFITVMLGAGAE